MIAELSLLLNKRPSEFLGLSLDSFEALCYDSEIIARILRERR
ncbi:MAG: hypothetical protein QXF43_04220 [Nitrososphaerales archaeon]